MAFTPYSIECITCGTRLKVTDASLVGQITFCLKCQSMVEVTLPEQASAETGGAAAPAPPRGQVDLGNGFDNLTLEEPPENTSAPEAPPAVHAKQELPPAPPSKPAEPSVQAAEPSTVPSKKKDHRKVAAVAAAISPVVQEIPRTAATASPVAAAPVAEPPLASAAAAAPASQFQLPAIPAPVWKKQLTLGLSAFSGVVLAIGAWVFWSAGQANDDVRPTAQRIEAATAAGEFAADRTQPQATEPKQEVPIPEVAVPEEPNKDPAPTEVARPPLPELPGEEVAAVDPPQVEPIVPEEKVPATEPPPGPGQTDPLADSPFNFDFGSPLPQPEGDRSDPKQPVADVQPRSVPKAPAPSAELEQLLRVSVPIISIRSLPLERFASFASQLIGRPVLLDPLALEAVGITRQTPVFLESRGASIDELLRGTLARHGLSYRALGDTLLITTPSPDETQMKRVRFRIGDLAESSSGMERFADLVRQVVSPGSWKIDGGPASIEIDGDGLLVDHGVMERYQTLVLCEKLRVARGIEPKSRYDASRFQLAARGVQTQAGLQRSISFDAGEPIPLNAMLRQLSHQSGMDLQLDHLALISAGLSSGLEVNLAVHDEPLDKALAQLLEPLELVYYPLNAETIVVTTPYALDRTMMWELFAVPENLTTVTQVDEWVDQLCREVKQASWATSGGPGTIAFDRGSRHVVVRQNPAVLAELAQRLGG